MHSVLFWLLANPLTVFLALIGLAIANLWRKRRESRRRLLAITVPYLVLVLLSTPAFIHLMRGILEWQYPPLENRPNDIDVIVVLGSSIEPNEESPTGIVLDVSSISRCDCAIKMYRLGERCPILVTGGRSRPDVAPCTELMRDYLISQGVPSADIIVEDQSTDTYENVRNSKSILNERGFQNPLLITDAIHMLRSERCFKHQGIAVVPCACHHLSTMDNPGRLQFWPHPRALKSCRYVCYEWLALPWYWVRGRI